MHAQGSVATCVCRNPAHDAMHKCVCSNQCNKKGGCAVRAVVTCCPALLRRAGPLAPRDIHSLAKGHLFFLVSVGGAGRALVASLVCAAWHDMVTYLRSWWRCVAPPLPTTRLHAAAYLLFPMQAGGCWCGTHVCCVFALPCCSFSWLCVVSHASAARHAWRPSYSSIPFCLLAAVVVSLHVRRYARAGIPFAPFRLLRKRACGQGGGHVSVTPRGHLLHLLAPLPFLSRVCCVSNSPRLF